MSSKFNLDSSLAVMAEAVVTMKGAEGARLILNTELKECLRAKVKWSEMRDKLAAMLEKRGLEGGTMRVTLSTIKWCFEEQVELETFTKSVMTQRADKGLVKDLISGKSKTVKPKAKKADKEKKTKTEAVVKHCGYGMAEAMSQPGFMAFFNTLVYDLYATEQDVGALLDDDKLDFIRRALQEHGYMTQDGAEWKVAVIKESDDEISE